VGRVTRDEVRVKSVSQITNCESQLFMKKVFLIVAIVFLAHLCGCVVASPPQSINTDPLVEVVAIDEVALFAADRDGHKVAVAKGGLTLVSLDSKSEQKLSPDQPISLSWSPDGLVLAAAFSTGDYETRLKLYSAQGKPLHETLLPVALSQMIWSARGDLLATGFVLKTFSFGGNLLQLLYKVDGDDVETTVLSDTTLTLATMQKILPIMQGVLPVAFSPSGDALIYAHVHDPPQFSPFLQLLHRNWQSGGKRPLQRMPLQQLSVDWYKSGQSVKILSSGGVQKVDLWAATGVSADLPAGGRYRFANGQLYDDEELLADWGDGAFLQILSGGRFLLSVNKSLYLGGGVQDESNENYSEKMWNLRRWRFEGLITPDEYLNLSREENP